MKPFLVAALLAIALPVPAAEPAAREVQATDLVVGDGAEIRRGWFAVMHYTGWVLDAGKSTTFVYGYKRALEGLEIGMRGMKVGGKRAIVVPAALGYDGFKHPVPQGVPEKSALVFEVELLDVVPQGNAD